MNSTLLQRALDQAGIPFGELDPQILIANRFADGKSTWVIFVAAANAFAFEMPGAADYSRMLDMAAAVARWDVAMAEGETISGDTVRLMRWAAKDMLPCELKEILVSTYGA